MISPCHAIHRTDCALLLVGLLTLTLGITLRVSAQTPVPPATTTNGVPLSDLLKKWEHTSLDDVERLANSGDLTAQHYLGYCNAEAFRMTRNPQVGAAWYKRAMRGGYLPSANNLANLHLRGMLGMRDLDQAIRYYNFAIERGYVPAQVNLGRLYQIEGRQTDAFRAFQKAAEQDSTDAMTELYRCYWVGRGVPSDHAKAMEWLTKAAEANDPEAQCLMGYRCETREWKGEGENRRLTPKKPLEAFRWYRRSAEQNWPGGLYHLGLCYLKGDVVERDEARALELIRTAADEGVEDAIHDLARLYARGIGEPRSEQDRPMALLRRIGAWGDLMVRYEHGLGTREDLVEAARCYSKLALSGSSYYHSPDNLADKVEFKPVQRSWGNPMMSAPDGHGQLTGPSGDSSHPPSDDVLRALSLILKAAKGDGQSAERIGEKYALGDGAEQSAVKAWAWFTVAAQNGAPKAGEKAKALSAHLTDAETTAGREYLQDLRKELKQVASR
jgi:TPR repeat protein